MYTIRTSKARCRDCYKCIRHCPVKAIALKDGQARVVEEECILCGRCINICPQEAKSTETCISKFESMLASKEPVVVSLAPSYLAAFKSISPWRIISALKVLGVLYVEETAIGAEIIAGEYNKILKGNSGGNTLISSCCPVIVNLIEKHFPSLVKNLTNLISPMQVHARLIKKRLGEKFKVVFIGPCYGKKEEIEKDQENCVDAVLTFTELIDFLQERNISLNQLPESYPDLVSSAARTYPLRGGIFDAAGFKASSDCEVISVSGIEECLESFRDLERGLLKPRFIEAMACKGGCINGPAMPEEDLGVFARQKLLYERLKVGMENCLRKEEIFEQARGLNLTRSYSPVLKEEKYPTEEEIRQILALTGKTSPEDETNCGGCGYSSCREKAIAVYRGLAEPEMCIPYMRERAESISNIVVESTVNAIIVVDKDMKIQEFNPAANKMFNRKNDEPKGKHLSSFINPGDFQEVFKTQKMKVVQRRAYPQYGLVTRQIIYPLPKYNYVVGIIIDVTSEEKSKEEKARMRKEALSRASRVIKEQMKVVQEVAGLLGESTAETKATLYELIEIMDEGDESGGGQSGSQS